MLAVAALPPHLLDVVATALDQSDDVIAVLQGHDLQVIGANDAFGRLTGIAALDAVGEMLVALLGVATDDPARLALTAAAQAGEAIQTELHCRRRDGSSYWFGLHLMPADQHRHVLLGRDITERRQTRARHEAAEALLATVFRHVDAAVAIVDAGGQLLMTNPQLDRLLGFEPGALGRRLANDLVAPESQDAVEAARTQQLQNGQSFSLTVSLLRADQTPILARLNSVMIERKDLQRFRIVTLTPKESPSDKPRSAVAGKMRLIGMTEVKAELGERWEMVAERALRTAEHILQRRLGPRDTVTRMEDQGLLICFADLTEEEASLRADAISLEIRQRLIGLNQKQPAARVSSVVASVEMPDGSTVDVIPLAQVLEERLHARRANIEATARQTMGTILRDESCVLHRVQQRDGSTLAHYARFPPGVEARITAAVAALPSEEAAAFDLNLLRLNIAVEQAHEAAASGKRLPVLIDVAFDIFETRAYTERYTDVLRGIDARAREQIILMLTDQPEGITVSRQRDCMLRLRPYCREVGFVMSKLELPQAGLIDGGTLTAAIACDALMAGGVLAEEALFQFLPPLHVRRGRLLVFGIPSVHIARGLREIGVDLVALNAPPGS